eukprot:COSAG02_NODE_181_length_30783_cov_53.060520_16_plen_112_part_00
MNAVESSIAFLFEFSTICGVDRSEWNSETWSLIIHRSVSIDNHETWRVTEAVRESDDLKFYRWACPLSLKKPHLIRVGRGEAGPAASTASASTGVPKGKPRKHGSTERETS